MKEKFKHIFKIINTPLIISGIMFVTATIIVFIIMTNGDDTNSPVANHQIFENSGSDNTSYTTEITSSEPASSEVSSETTGETTTKYVYTTLAEYTTIPIEEIVTTDDNSDEDEVMGGGNNDYEDDVFDGEDEVPIVKPTTTPSATKPTTEASTTTKDFVETTTEKVTTTEATTTEKPTTKPVIPETSTSAPTTEATTTSKDDTTIPTTPEETTTEKDTTTKSNENDETETSTSVPETSTNNTTDNSSTNDTTSEDTTTPEETTTEAPTTKPSSNVIKKPDDFILDISYGCDVSRWQGDIDWARAKAAGVDFVMIKLGGRSTSEEGAIYMDSKFERNIKGALENDVKVGIYFFSQAITIREAIEEASYCIEVLKDYDIDYPVCFDFEQGKASDKRRTYLAMADGRLTKELLTEIACAFCNTLETAGYESMIYASRNSWKSERWDGEFLNQNYRTWLAVWYKTTSYMAPTFGTGNTEGLNTFKSKYYKWLPTFEIKENKGNYVMWQYSDSGRIDGIPGYVDLDMCFYINESYEGYTSPLAIKIENPIIDVNAGSDIDLMAGVTGTNTVLVDKTRTITYSILNPLGMEVSKKDALANEGTYTVKYMITDFTGCKRYAEATLNVK